MHIHAGSAAPFGPASGLTWVLVIVVLVVLMRLLLLPLFVKQMHSQRKMIALAPADRRRCASVQERQAEAQEEMMKLYKENGANPLSGCLPLVAQLPIWFALLNVLRAMSEDKALYGLTPLVVHQAQQRQDLRRHDLLQVPLPAPGDPGQRQGRDRDHRRDQRGHHVPVGAAEHEARPDAESDRGRGQPDGGRAEVHGVHRAAVRAVSGLYWQFGLVLYWMTSNIWQLGQQYFLFKRSRRWRRRPPRRRPRTAVSGKAWAPPPRQQRPGRRPSARSPAAKRAARPPSRPAAGKPAARAAAGKPVGRAGSGRARPSRRLRRASRRPREAACRGEAACPGQEARCGEDGGGRARHPAADPEREWRRAAQAGPGTRGA